MVLPAPFGPTKPKISPSRTQNVMSCSTRLRRRPKPGRTSLVTASTRTISARLTPRPPAPARGGAARAARASARAAPRPRVDVHAVAAPVERRDDLAALAVEHPALSRDLRDARAARRASTRSGPLPELGGRADVAAVAPLELGARAVEQARAPLGLDLVERLQVLGRARTRPRSARSAAARKSAAVSRLSPAARSRVTNAPR